MLGCVVVDVEAGGRERPREDVVPRGLDRVEPRVDGMGADAVMMKKEVSRRETK